MTGVVSTSPTQALNLEANHGAVKMKFALAISLGIAIAGFIALVEEQRKMVHRIDCDGTTITVHDTSIREASHFAVQHCRNFTMLP